MANIYFIEAVGLNLIKIGVAKSVEKRMYELQNASPVELKLRGVIRYVSACLEKQLHKAFGKQRCRGEWYEIDSRMEALLNDPEGYCKRHFEDFEPRQIDPLPPLFIESIDSIDDSPERSEELGRLLKRRADLLGLDAGDIADVTGLSTNFVERCFSGDIPINANIVRILADILNLIYSL